MPCGTSKAVRTRPATMSLRSHRAWYDDSFATPGAKVEFISRCARRRSPHAPDAPRGHRSHRPRGSSSPQLGETGSASTTAARQSPALGRASYSWRVVTSFMRGRRARSEVGRPMTTQEALAAWGAYDQDDPFPLFAGVREAGAVHPVTLAAGHDAWLVARYDEAPGALTD